MRVFQDPSSDEAVAFVFSNPLMRQVHQQATQAASSSLPILLRGEKGVGKRTLARIIHRSSGFKGPFVEANCRHLNEERQHRELFGCGKNSNGGSLLERPGKIRFARGGTLYLEGGLVPSVQCRLIRLIQDKQLASCDRKERDCRDWRLIVSLESDLSGGSEEDRVGFDGYRELEAVEIEIPPLRSRRDEIPLLCDFFLRRLGSRYEGLPLVLPEALMRRIGAQDWSGENLSELEEAIKSFLRDNWSRSPLPSSMPRWPDVDSGKAR